MNNFKIKNNKGFSIIEVVIVCAVISICLFALMSSAGKSIQVSNQSLRQAQATLLIEEGVESIKSIRDNNWTNISGLTNGQKYYLSFNNNWSLSPTVSNIDGLFTREVVSSAVYRDSNDNIAESGTLDSGTVKFTVTVHWSKPNGTVSKSLSFYVSNIFN